MHLIHQNVPGLCWGDPKDPPILKTNTSRQRLNILGAYNPDSHSFVHLTGEENCDAKRVIEYFDVILKAYRRAPAIVLFLDNATYFKAEIVTTWLKDHPKLKLEFLPPYAPNLNLIERFWRFVKEHLFVVCYLKFGIFHRNFTASASIKMDTRAYRPCRSLNPSKHSYNSNPQISAFFSADQNDLELTYT